MQGRKTPRFESARWGDMDAMDNSIQLEPVSSNTEMLFSIQNMASVITMSIDGEGDVTANSLTTPSASIDSSGNIICKSLAVGATHTRSGLRNSILSGTNNWNTTNDSVVGGTGNSITAGVNQAILSGDSNSINASDNNTILGGFANQMVSGDKGTIASGFGNYMDPGGTCNIIGGGSSNSIAAGTMNYSSILNGESNIISGLSDYGSLCGGYSNWIDNANSSSIGGGYQNYTNNDYTTIAGGINNRAIALYTTVAGGNQNYADDTGSSVLGGYDNVCNSSYGTITGGQSNDVTGSNATVSGGHINNCSGPTTTISGGRENSCTAIYGSICGGWGAISSNMGQRAWAGSGYIAALGDSQVSDYTLRNAVTGAGLLTLYLDYPTNSLEIAVGGTCWAVMDLNIICVRTGANQSSAYKNSWLISTNSSVPGAGVTAFALGGLVSYSSPTMAGTPTISVVSNNIIRIQANVTSVNSVRVFSYARITHLNR